MTDQHELSRSITAVTDALLESLRAHDAYTYGHCRRVGLNAQLLAQSAGLGVIEQRIAQFAGLLHDIGKIGIPEKILRKEGPFTESEEAIMRTHSEKSVEIIAPLTHIPFFRAILPGVRHHHERIDGLGYPYGLHAAEVPLIARIVTIVDAVDAITTRRTYRDHSPMQSAYEELVAHAGTQFDADLVGLFVRSHPTWHRDFQIAPIAPWADAAAKKSA